MPFIEDARKPTSFGFEAMQAHFNLAPEQIVVVGDGLLSDVMGAKRRGMKAIRARWHTNNYYLKWEPFLSLWDSFTIAVNCLRVLFFTQRQPQLTGLDQTI
jgi:FMN phosphatase YigB (HAD superfamily)